MLSLNNERTHADVFNSAAIKESTPNANVTFSQNNNNTCIKLG